MFFFILNIVLFFWGIALVINGTATWLTIIAMIFSGLAAAINYGELQ